MDFGEDAEPHQLALELGEVVARPEGLLAENLELFRSFGELDVRAKRIEQEVVVGVLVGLLVVFFVVEDLLATPVESLVPLFSCVVHLREILRHRLRMLGSREPDHVSRVVLRQEDEVELALAGSLVHEFRGSDRVRDAVDFCGSARCQVTKQVDLVVCSPALALVLELELDNQVLPQWFDSIGALPFLFCVRCSPPYLHLSKDLRQSGSEIVEEILVSFCDCPPCREVLST